MRLEKTAIAGVLIASFERHLDERGFFQRIYDREAFLEAGLADCARQCSLSWNPVKGTLRGLHYQLPPHEETKLVRCLQGRIFDVVADLRQGSPTFAQWIGVELSANNGQALYIPHGFAHGFLTLDDDSLVQYQMAEPFVPGAASGLRWDDPELGVAWPAAPVLVGEKDNAWGGLKDVAGQGSH